jgi:hypothetical protein
LNHRWLNIRAYIGLTAFFNAPLDFCSDVARYVCREHLALVPLV